MSIIPPWVYPAVAGAILTIGIGIGISGTRAFYKAGQVDALKGQIETLEKTSSAKDDLLSASRSVNGETKDIMGRLTDALIDVTARQPKHTETIKTEFKDAPEKYAEFDPNKCLSYVYPDGMRNSLEKAITAHLASLPEFDASGHRVIQPSASKGR